MYAVRHISFSKCQILTTGTVLRVNMHHRAKFGAYRTIDCKDMAIFICFYVSRRRPSAILNFQTFKILTAVEVQRVNIRHRDKFLSAIFDLL